MLLLLLVFSVPTTPNDKYDNGSHEGADCSPDENSWVDSVVIVALGVLPLVVVVPLRTVSVEIAALPRAVLKCAALVVAHLFFYLFLF